MCGWSPFLWTKTGMAWSFEPQGAGKGIALGCSIKSHTQLCWHGVPPCRSPEVNMKVQLFQHNTWYFPIGFQMVAASSKLETCWHFAHICSVSVLSFFSRWFADALHNKTHIKLLQSTASSPSSARGSLHGMRHGMLTSKHAKSSISNKSSPNMTSWNVHTVNIPTLLSQSAWPCMVSDKVTKAKSTHQLLSMLRMLDTAVGKTLVPMEEYHQDNHHRIWSCNGCPTQ